MTQIAGFIDCDFWEGELRLEGGVLGFGRKATIRERYDAFYVLERMARALESRSITIVNGLWLDDEMVFQAGPEHEVMLSEVLGAASPFKANQPEALQLFAVCANDFYHTVTVEYRRNHRADVAALTVDTRSTPVEREPLEGEDSASFWKRMVELEEDIGGMNHMMAEYQASLEEFLKDLLDAVRKELPIRDAEAYSETVAVSPVDPDVRRLFEMGGDPTALRPPLRWGA